MMPTLDERFAQFPDTFARLRDEVNRGFIGQPRLVEEVLYCLIARGHALIEGMPGLGKTLLIKTIAAVFDLEASRIQCTPDLMPADIIGTNLMIESPTGPPTLQFTRGPIFANVVLADEINRATPKTQSAFLEAMQERRVTSLGKTLILEEPFFLLATQNPIELEGTYPLPEAQLDRFFFKLGVEFPSLDDLARIVDLTTGPGTSTTSKVASREELLALSTTAREVILSDAVKMYALRLVRATHPDLPSAPPVVRECVRYGASPRAAQSLILGAKVRALADGRGNVAYEDVTALAAAALTHRLLLSFEAEVSRVSAADVVAAVVAHVER